MGWEQKVSENSREKQEVENLACLEEDNKMAEELIRKKRNQFSLGMKGVV